MTSLSHACASSNCLSGSWRIHRQFDLEASAYIRHLYNRNAVVSTHACSLRPDRLCTEWKATTYGAFVIRWRIHLGLSVNASLHTLYQLLGLSVPAHTLCCISSRALRSVSNPSQASQFMERWVLTQGTIAAHASLSQNGR